MVTEQPGNGRAVVLGAGGVTGVAWEIGLLHGLAERGLDLTGADLFARHLGRLGGGRRGHQR